MLLTIVVNWERIAGILGGLVLVNSFLKEWFGVSLLGKKIYKGAPAFWKWMMRAATFRKEVQDWMKRNDQQMERMVDEHTYNGGSTTKDMVRKTYTMMLKLSDRIAFNEIRLDVNDVYNKHMTMIMNRDAECVFVNSVFLKHFGYTEEEILKANYELIVHEEDVQEMRVKWSRAIATRSNFSDEQRIFDSQKREHFVCVSGHPFINGQGELENYFVTYEILS